MQPLRTIQTLLLVLSLLGHLYVPSLCHASVHAADVEALHAADCGEHRDEHSAKHHEVPQADEMAATLTQARKIGAASSVEQPRSDVVLISHEKLFLPDLSGFLFLRDLPHLHFSQQARLSHFAAAPPA